MLTYIKLILVGTAVVVFFIVNILAYQQIVLNVCLKRTEGNIEITDVEMAICINKSHRAGLGWTLLKERG